MATQSEIKYKRLMEKAEELFVKLGYKAVSMDEIAEAAGISKMTIYKHFPSKEKLFLEVVLSLMDRVSAMFEEEMKEIPGTLEKINFMMNYNLKDSKNYSFAFYKDAMEIPYVTEKLLEEKYRRGREIFEWIIKEGVEKGEIRKVNTSIMTDMLMMMTEGFAEKYFDKIKTQEDPSTLAEGFYDFLKYGLLGGKGVE
ncbi:transcriptional regulator, TetR family [Anaerovirgula multivorans]|uniref:Transcriptional regulator, TetR family n=1 Tax=Anaerovirgula multivorans TaxID=312168 RepID=A0A239F2E5_9FIRM|nr:TetR/AcrR family transcriptional regulator [Anaerovirgula multivorans]SNS50718.1 transcriptional regulator, TetR family [Anaerovirgula multivorans]